jgi:hypothetical protein
MQKEKIKAVPPSEYLTFEDICPNWADKLRMGLDKQDTKILMHDSKYCIVGESWGFTGKQTGYYIAPLIPFVGCWTCVKFGKAMGNVVKHYGQSFTSDHLRHMIHNFVQHWNENHENHSHRKRRTFTLR